MDQHRKARRIQPTDTRTWIPPLYDVVVRINILRENADLRPIPHGRCLTTEEVYWLDDHAEGWDRA